MIRQEVFAAQAMLDRFDCHQCHESWQLGCGMCNATGVAGKLKGCLRSGIGKPALITGAPS